MFKKTRGGKKWRKRFGPKSTGGTMFEKAIARLERAAKALEGAVTEDKTREYHAAVKAVLEEKAAITDWLHKRLTILEQNAGLEASPAPVPLSFTEAPPKV